jgi:hypothetical protein
VLEIERHTGQASAEHTGRIRLAQVLTALFFHRYTGGQERADHRTGGRAENDVGLPGIDPPDGLQPFEGADQPGRTEDATTPEHQTPPAAVTGS